MLVVLCMQVTTLALGAEIAEINIYPRPGLANDGSVLLLPSLPTVKMGNHLPVQVRVFNYVSRFFKNSALEKKLAQYFEQGLLAQTLQEIDPDWSRTLLQENVAVLLDDLAFMGDKHRMFYWSFTEEKRTLIWIDFRIALGLADDLEPALTHELAHILLLHKNVPSWLNEAIAQLAEMEAGGRVPLQLANSALASAKELPNLFEHNKYFSKELYGLTYLFGRYIHQNYNGWDAIRHILSDPSQDKKRDIVFIATKLGVHMDALLDDFFHALQLGTGKRLPGWNGFVIQPIEPLWR